jgi:hypothetical protein
MAATFTHLMIWNFDDLKGAWGWCTPSGLKRIYRNFDWKFWRHDGMRDIRDDEDLDPHYRQMLKVSDSREHIRGRIDSPSVSTLMHQTAGIS